MAETQPVFTKEKKNVNASTTLPVSNIRHTSTQGAEKTAASELSHVSVQESMTPVIAEEGSTNNLEKPKKPRKPRNKKKKNNSDTTERAQQVQPANIIITSSSGDTKKRVHFSQEPSTIEMDQPNNKIPIALSTEKGVPEAISNHNPMTQVMPAIAEEGLTNNLEKPKKQRKPKNKKRKNNSDTTEQAQQVQPANIIITLSSGDTKKRVRFSQEPSTIEMDQPNNKIPLALSTEKGVPEAISNQNPMTQVMPAIAEEGLTNNLEKPKKPRALSTEKGVPEAISNQNPMTQVMPAIAEEGLTNNLEKPKKPRKPKNKKNKNNSDTTEQAQQVQPANIIITLSSGDTKKRVRFSQEPSTSKLNSPKKIKPLAPSAEQSVPEAISNQIPMKQVLPVIAEESSTNNLGKPKKSRRPRMKKNKNHSDTAEQALQMQPANINKASSCAAEKVQVHVIQEPTTSKIYPPKIIKISTPSAKQDVPETVSYQYSMGHFLPVITEETSADILEKPKEQRQLKQKKTKHNSNKVEQALQMQPGFINGASFSADEIQECRSNVEAPNDFVTQDAKDIDFGTNKMNQKSETGQQTKNVIPAIESKEHGQENDTVNKNITEITTKKKILLTDNVAKANGKLQTSKDALQVTEEKAKRGAQTPMQITNLPTEAVGNDDEELNSTSKDALKEPYEKSEENAAAQVPLTTKSRHLLFFREFYDHAGRLNVPMEWDWNN